MTADLILKLVGAFIGLAMFLAAARYFDIPSGIAPWIRGCAMGLILVLFALLVMSLFGLIAW